MRVETNTAELVQRLNAVEWSERIDRVGSRTRLAQEYLRRSALWARALGCTNRWPYFDIAAHVRPPAALDEEYVESVLDALADRGANYLDRSIARYMLNFTALQTWPEGLPHPFEPLVRLFERGGGFAREAGSTRIGAVVGIPEASWERHIDRSPLEDMSDAALDRLDDEWAEAHPRRSGSTPTT
ncbi:hypothetical protein ACFQY4_09435 [Catellatospora bangladeshensis]|uniref:Uncharacterized protein n=1 Tax=Catellatospora bangladeshensis TaxID=310355 RepID=A0A8J3J833_9ACTN|nr:hypothetical protein [Catellatospora bangladeshensis]GIF79056.1 hypothetical protein Cba03nite_04050 [Catellatospora bangladeshensis]